MESVLRYPVIESVRHQAHYLSFLSFLAAFGQPPQVYEVDRASMVEALLAAGLGVYLHISLPYHDPDRFHLKNVRPIPVVDDVRPDFGYIAKEPVLAEPYGQLMAYIKAHLHDLLT